MNGWKTTVLSVVLAFSLLGNALAIGAGIRLYRVWHGMLGETAAVSLPRATRRELAAALASHADEMKLALQRVQIARGDAVQAILAKPYDAAQAAAALDTLRQAIDTLMQQGQNVVLDDLRRRGG